jgi:Zn-finger nucleic acid-binding protein
MPELSCPGCGKSLDALKQTGVEFAICSGCRGMWLDAGALEKRGAAFPEGMQLETIGKRVCPRCARPMAVYFHELLEVDRCSFCGGTYLDAGEIDILMKVAKVAPPKPQKAGASSRTGGSAMQSKPKFLCDLCHRWLPVEQQIIGEQLTVCVSCSKLHDVKHNPAARRKTELARQCEKTKPTPLDMADDSHPGKDWSEWSSRDVLTVVGIVLYALFKIIH